ncbi:MAG: hypothetical protein SGJ21_03075 [Alphaproteobacteria bacterium]|nr:hypothetical protein [Alphaproteobacteria bacterium]
MMTGTFVTGTFVTRTFDPVRWSALVLGCAAVLAGCGGPDPVPAAGPVATAEIPAPPAPIPVDGWAEYPLGEGVVRFHPAKWRSDTIKIPVPANGGDLEYKLSLKKGDAVVYSIDFGDIDHPGLFVSEFHGHTEKRADGVGDLMYYSKEGIPNQHGQFTAPWDGIHGWYLKNDSPRDAVVTLDVAGFFEIVPK